MGIWEGSWTGVGTVTEGGMPRETTFSFTFEVLQSDPNGNDVYRMTEYHNWNSTNLPTEPTNIGIFTLLPEDFQPLGGTTEELNVSPGFTVTNLWEFLPNTDGNPHPDSLPFWLRTTFTGPPDLPFPLPPATEVTGSMNRA